MVEDILRERDFYVFLTLWIVFYTIFFALSNHNIWKLSKFLNVSAIQSFVEWLVICRRRWSELRVGVFFFWATNKLLVVFLFSFQIICWFFRCDFGTNSPNVCHAVNYYVCLLNFHCFVYIFFILIRQSPITSMYNLLLQFRTDNAQMQNSSVSACV